MYDENKFSIQNDVTEQDVSAVALPAIIGVQIPEVSNSEYCTVRFLNAASGYGPLNITIGSRMVVNNLAFSNVSAYTRVVDGFYFVVVSSTRNSGNILFRGRIPFNANEVITMAIVKSANGLNFVRVSDQPCKNRPRNRGCVRVANLIYNSPPMNVILTDGRIAFADVQYKEVTSYKQARPGEYDFYVAKTPYALSPALTDIDILDNLPIVLTNFFLPGYGEVTPLVSSSVVVKAGGMYTIYLLGNWENSSEVRIKII